MKTPILTAWIVLMLSLAACGSAPQTDPALPGNLNSGSDGAVIWIDQSPRVDTQGAVSVEVAPLNLTGPGETLDFQISMNTHSVDLSMNLAQLATLTTDKGVEVHAKLWDAPLGGHHVSGVLSFPSEAEGAAVLAGASVLTLKLVDVDASERIFVWENQP